MTKLATLTVDKKLKVFQVECGKLGGIINARSPSIAFRKLIKLEKIKSGELGILARFRQVIVSKDWLIVLGRGQWFYQNPEQLFGK